MTVLIVDDIPINLNLLSAILTSQNHSVICARDGQEALEILETQVVDAVISDILMPRLDGYRLCHEIRTDPRLCHLPFIFYTATYTSSQDEKLARDFGGDIFLIKPIAPEVLIEALARASAIHERHYNPPSLESEVDLLKEYNQRLVSKLEQKNTELSLRNEKLERSEETLLLQSKALETVSNAVFITNTKGIILWVNPAFERLTGFSSQEAVGSNPRLFKSGKHLQEHYRNLWMTVLSGKCWRGTFINRHKDGHLFYDEQTITPVQEKEGKVSHFISIMNDVTSQKQNEERIAEQAEFLDKARDAIFVRDLTGTILFWNQGAERLYGWTRNEAVGKNICDLIQSDADQFDEWNKRVIVAGEWSGELKHTIKCGSETVVQARFTLIRDSEGRPKSILAINTDITEEKKYEAQLMRAQRMEGLGTLAGGIAHDLNNILTPILMSIELLRSISGNPQAGGVLDAIEGSAQRGADIVRQVLTFARGVEVGERRAVDPQQVLKELKNIIQDTFPRNIRLQFSVPDQIWRMLGNPTQIQQILLNLSVNSRDSMPKGGVLDISMSNFTLDEETVEDKPGPYVKIMVSDSGTGIPAEILNKIFDPFFTTKELGLGSGLGLSTVQAIVKSHGGMINVYSEYGKGTAVTVYLPATEAIQEKQPQSVNLGLPERGNGETILVVDDEPPILVVTRKTLEAFGYHVLTAANGAEGVALFVQQRAKVALVISDMMMPIMDGPTMIHALLSINPDLKIIAASGLHANIGMAKLSGSGVNQFLTKPYAAPVLLKTIRKTLDSSPAAVLSP